MGFYCILCPRKKLQRVYWHGEYYENITDCFKGFSKSLLDSTSSDPKFLFTVIMQHCRCHNENTENYGSYKNCDDVCIGNRGELLFVPTFRVTAVIHLNTDYFYIYKVILYANSRLNNKN